MEPIWRVVLREGNEFIFKHNKSDMQKIQGERSK